MILIVLRLCEALKERCMALLGWVASMLPNLERRILERRILERRILERRILERRILERSVILMPRLKFWIECVAFYVAALLPHVAARTPMPLRQCSESFTGR